MFNNLYSLAYTVKTREREGVGKKENEGSNADEITVGNQEVQWKGELKSQAWIEKSEQGKGTSGVNETGGDDEKLRTKTDMQLSSREEKTENADGRSEGRNYLTQIMNECQREDSIMDAGQPKWTITQL